MVLKRVRQLVLLCNNPKYRKILFSDLFDPIYYLNRYPDVASQGGDPLLHYCNSGWSEGRRPSLIFDSLYYIRNYDITQGQIDPLVHYIDEGWQNGNNPNVYFDTAYYLTRHGGEFSEKTNPLFHYLDEGWEKGYLPSEIFARGEYHRVVHRLKGGDVCPLMYFLEKVDAVRDNPPAYFDSGWYHDQNPGLPRDTLALWHHYIDYGVHEGKNPLPIFKSSYYLKGNSERDAYIPEPFAHYKKKENIDKRSPAPWFDPEYYRASYPVKNNWHHSMLEHYLKFGVFHQTYADQRIADLVSKPVISIIVPVYNPAPHHLNNCIRSVLFQAYPHWEICLCDDRSTAPHVRPILERWATLDKRIHVTRHTENQGIAAATNSAVSLATGTYIGFLDNDDELSMDCLYQIVKTINETGADVLYTDEDLIGEDGRQFSTFYKPGYNRELLLCHNYITHFVVTLRELFVKVGGCDPKLDGAQDFDLLLKLTEVAKMVVHVPEVVYHWRASETSTSINHDQKGYADSAGITAVEASLARTRIQGKVEATEWKFYYKTSRVISEELPVTVLAYIEALTDESFHNVLLLAQNTQYTNAEYILVCTRNHPEAREWCLRLQAQLGESITSEIYLENEELTKAQAFNNAAKDATGEYLVFVSSDVCIKKYGWLEALIEYGQSREVGMVRGRLNSLAEMEKVDHIPNIRCESPLYFMQFLTSCSIHMNGLQWPQEVMAVPMELFMMKAGLFISSGGFRAQLFPGVLAAVDLSFRLRTKGYLNIYTPYCEADWVVERTGIHESRHKDTWMLEKHDFQHRWRETLSIGDPYYHPGCYRAHGITDEEFIQWCSGVK